MFFEVFRVVICILLLFTLLYYIYLYLNGSGSITSAGEERVNLSAVVYL